MAKELLETIAYEKGLEYIETTTGMNGYPQHLRGAIIGFETFAEAEEVASEYGLRITTFFKRNGWQLYQRDSNTTWEPLKITSYDYGDGYKHFTNEIPQEDFIEEELLPNLAATTFGDIQNITQKYEELFDKIVEAEDDELVIADILGEYVETIKKGTDVMESRQQDMGNRCNGGGRMMKKQEYIGCWYCDNLVDHPDQVGLLHLGFPRCFVLIPNSYEFEFSSYEEFYEGLCEVNWLDPNDKGTPDEQEEVLRLLWNFSIAQEEEEERRFLMNGGYADDDEF